MEKGSCNFPFFVPTKTGIKIPVLSFHVIIENNQPYESYEHSGGENNPHETKMNYKFNKVKHT